MIGRLLRSTDFERVLRTRTRASSTHFALHHLLGLPSLPHKPMGQAEILASSSELSTGNAPRMLEPVDDLPSGAQRGVWLGTVVPKRHARRAVTRTLLKRQIRLAVSARAGALLGGLWVVRLRAPFDKVMFPSAASVALRTSARRELDLLLSSAAR